MFDENLVQTAKEMLLIMYAAEGVGLAAPQVQQTIQLRRNSPRIINNLNRSYIRVDAHL